jgi:hydroxymethylglutaryl-CoA reductase
LQVFLIKFLKKIKLNFVYLYNALNINKNAEFHFSFKIFKMKNNYADFLFGDFPDFILDLKAHAPAKWGKMNMHQMIEHLAHVISLSNGRFIAKPSAEPERLAYRKMRFFEKDIPLQKNVRVESIPEDPIPPMFVDIEQSKDFLMVQLQRFHDYHEEHPDMTPMHSVFGELTYDEWIQFHARHVRHHLQQFGVLEEDVK